MAENRAEAYTDNMVESLYVREDEEDFYGINFYVMQQAEDRANWIKQVILMRTQKDL
ncbi:hypothetical protein [Histophilus somni]|uniref:hypothetical protein n=1 Tax=Histophilus somni TaxID=731 RepID=UPI00201F4CE9|nr:hypothetical protein [Histophilus somni]